LDRRLDGPQSWLIWMLWTREIFLAHSENEPWLTSHKTIAKTSEPRTNFIIVLSLQWAVFKTDMLKAYRYTTYLHISKYHDRSSRQVLDGPSYICDQIACPFFEREQLFK
jgi:hypothetical protein